MSNDERTDKQDGGTLGKEPTTRTSDENQTLRDGGNLEVDNRVELVIVGVSKEFETKLTVEEVSLETDSNETNSRSSQVKTVDNGV